MFLKIGKYTINQNAITYINWQYKQENFDGELQLYTRIYFPLSQGNSEEFEADFIQLPADSIEAKALRSYLTQSSVDVLQQYQA